MHKIGYFLTTLLLIFILLHDSVQLKRSRRHKFRHHSRTYNLTFSIRNHNISEAKFFQIRGPGHSAYFELLPSNVFTQTFKARGKGSWILFVEFDDNYYAKSRPKLISRDSFPHWVTFIHIYYLLFNYSVGFTEWEKVTSFLKAKLY
uniref:Uncharacterized protein n=1 Tax=Syphacia muris TaxID=451379 RepID=A0A158R4R9_9BILA